MAAVLYCSSPHRWSFMKGGACGSEANSIWTKSSARRHSREPKRGFAVGQTKRGKGTKIVAIASDDVLTLAVSVESASLAECRLVKAVLAGCFLHELLERLIGDKAYDSDAHDQMLAEDYGIEMISSDRSNRKQKT